MNGNAVFRTNLIVIPIALIGLLVSFLCVIPKISLYKIFPILGNGLNETFFSGITNIYAFCGISYIYFLMPLLKDKNDFSKISYIGFAISSIYLLLAIASVLLSLSDAYVIEEISDMYLLIRSVEFGRFFQRPDALFFFIWVLSLMAYVTTILFLITFIFKKISNTSDRTPMIYAFAIILFVASLLPANMAQVRFLDNVIAKYVVITIIFIFVPIILILANLKYKKINLNNSTKGEISNDLSI